MNPFELYVSRVRALVSSLRDNLSPDECSRVEHLINHDECGEALTSLAWIIVNENKRVPAEAIAAIRELSEGLVADEDMPPNLDQHAI